MLRCAAMFFARRSRCPLPVAFAATALAAGAIATGLGACQPATPASAPAAIGASSDTASGGSAASGGTSQSASPSAAGDARARARALLQQMTREEKAASLVHVFDWTYKKTA